ncbi:hypothetical protein ACFU99_14495 [Streptomyces sp. NPDC057654]|uniref:hypothetical protein n=1 Tax=Streptomyces sp. NPDC057654 TaxID=3346196 RepID=UPI00368059DF
MAAGDGSFEDIFRAMLRDPRAVRALNWVLVDGLGAALHQAQMYAAAGDARMRAQAARQAMRPR